MLVPRRWLADTAQATPVRVAPCHPVTGALLDPTPTPGGRTAAQVVGADPVAGGAAGPGFTTDAYRPSARLAASGPGPRPALPLPRLHHRRRVLRPRPRATLAGRAHHRRQPDLPVPTPPPHQATTRLDRDPSTGRSRDLHRPHRPSPHHPPRRRPDQHRPTRCRHTPDQLPSASRARTLVPDGPHTALEFTLEHHGATPPGQPRATSTTLARPPRHARHRTDLTPATATATITLEPHGHRPHRPHQRRRPRHRDGGSDPPPF